MTLSSDIVAQYLGGRPFRYFDRISSTNDAARDWLLDGAPAGACVVADEQTAGRGRKARVWHTPPGSALAVSLILRPPADALAQVVMLGALAVAETVEGLESWARVEVKWPNDVLLDGRKVSGVLSEAVWQGDSLLGVVLGIGVNVRVDFAGSDLETTAVSLEAALGRPLERGVLLAMLLRRADEWAARLGTAGLFDAWKARLAMLGSAVTVTLEEARVTGVAEDVLPDGTLMLRTPDGATREVVAGDVDR